MKRIFALVLALSLALLCLAPAMAEETEKTGVTMRVASLKGPTTMGLVKLMQDAEAGLTANDYTFAMEGTADAISPLLIQGELDAAMIPCNLAAVLINRTEGALEIAAINTLGVLYVLENGDTIQSVEDLRGKTIFSTGQGTTPRVRAGLRAFPQRHRPGQRRDRGVPLRVYRGRLGDAQRRGLHRRASAAVRHLRIDAE